jgi:hypothetical protein
MRASQLLALGRLIIKARESIITAGLQVNGLPALALCRADAARCECSISRDGSGYMRSEGALTYWAGNRETSKLLQFPAGSFLPSSGWHRGAALVPAIPLQYRPRRGLANYHVLWEARWENAVADDPYLLRRIGKSDLWLVVAAWDVTEVERAALNARLAGV